MSVVHFERRTHKFPDRDERASQYVGSEKCVRSLEKKKNSTSFFLVEVLELFINITVPLTSYCENALKKLHKMGKIILLFKLNIYFLKT